MNPLHQFAQFIAELEVRFGAGWLFILKIVLFFLVMAILFLVLSVFSRLGKLRDSEIKVKRQAIFQNFLLDFLYGELEIGRANFDIPTVKAIRKKYLTTRFNVQLLIDEIVNLHKGLSGETAMRLQELFHHFELDHYCMAKLKAKSWQVKAGGINELREMRIVGAKNEIERLVNHPVQNVRSNAQIALLELDQSESRLNFFENLSFGLTEWDQLRLYESLKSRSGNHVKSFTILFRSENLDIVRFGIRMSNYFGCTSDIGDLKAILEHDDINIRREAIIALTQLGDFESHETLGSRFWGENATIQLLIIKYLEKIQIMDFRLLKHALFDPDYTLSMEAAYQINEHFIEQKASLISPLPESHPIRQRFAHAAEPSIRRK